MFVIFLFGFISLINNFWLLSESNTQPAKEINLVSLTKLLVLDANRMYMALCFLLPLQLVFGSQCLVLFLLNTKESVLIAWK